MTADDPGGDDASGSKDGPGGDDRPGSEDGPPGDDGPGDADGLDPVTLEVIDNRFDEAVREMQHVMFRTGYSTIIRDSKDASAGVCLPDGRVVGQAFRLPLHCGVFPPTVEGIYDYHDPADIEPGDAFVVNDPYRCGANHSPDMLVATPVFHGGALRAWCCTIAHKPDIGGLVPGTSSPDAREIYHEGLLLPPVKYRRAGEVNPDVENVIRNNSRTPEVTLGDVRGQVGCTGVGVEKVRALFEEYGPGAVTAAVERLLDSTRERVADAVRGWDDTVAVTGELDGTAGREAPIRIELSVSTAAGEGCLRFDFSGTEAQVDGPANMRPHVARSACYYGVVGALDASLPLDSGVAAACEFDLPERSVVNPERPAPCNNYSKGMCVVTHLALQALSEFDPAVAVAETGGKMSIAVGGRNDRSGRDGRSGGPGEADGERADDDAATGDAGSGDAGTENTGSGDAGTGDAGAGADDEFVHYEIIGSGYGGHAGADGAGCMASSYESNAEFASVEIVETEFPDRVTEFSLRTDSAGPGEHRGGVGFVREYEALAPLRFTYRGSNHAVASRGVAGGGSSGHASAVKRGEDGDTPLSTIDTVDLAPGERVRLERPGGAGYGDPHDRPPEAVLADVRDGVVSRGAAREAYGVALVEDGGDLRVDEAATTDLREGSDGTGDGGHGSRDGDDHGDGDDRGVEDDHRSGDHGGDAHDDAERDEGPT